MYDIIFFDLDGTLLTSDKKISSYTFQTLLTVKNRNVELVLNTGRSLCSVKAIAQKYLVDLIRYFICNNGRVIYDAKLDQFLFLDAIPKEEILSFAKLPKKNVAIFYASTDGVYIETPKTEFEQSCIDEFNEEEYRNLPVSVCVVEDIKEIISNKQIVRIYIHASEEAVFQEYFAESPDLLHNKKVYQLYGNYCMFLGTKNDKEEGMRKICDLLNLKPERAIAFGDEDNDTKILQAVGKGYALCNGIESVKKIATDITEYSSDHDGVAIELQKLMRQGLL